MPPFDNHLVLPLRLAQNHFLEVLLSRFILRRQGGGAELEVSFDGDTPAVWNRIGREEVRRRIPDFERKAIDYQRKLDDFLLQEHHGLFRFEDNQFVFRWVSAGALPIIRMLGGEFYCLFYRKIFPIGWNIANGASDSVDELLDPLRILERELAEELIILDPSRERRYVFNTCSSDTAEFASSYQALNQILSVDITAYDELVTSVKWLEGPDRVTVTTADTVKSLAGWFLNINGIDFGIELDKVARISVGDDVVICDGEIVEGRALNRIIGLFDVEELNARLATGSTEFAPEHFFFRGKSYSGAAFSEFMAREFLPDIEWQGVEVTSRYLAAPSKYDLCPATRRIISRNMPTAASKSRR